MVEDCQNIFTIQLSKEASLIKVSPAPENMIVNNVGTSELDLIGYEEIKNASISASLQNSSCQLQGNCAQNGNCKLPYINAQMENEYDKTHIIGL